jgi:hypothetical protein
MIFEFWWGTGGTGSRFLAEVKASKELVEKMVRSYNITNPAVSFVTFLRMHNIPASNIDPIRVEFTTEERLSQISHCGAEIRHAQEITIL